MANVVLDTLLKQLDDAYRSGNTSEINRINAEIHKSLNITVTESTVDYDFINNIKGKSLFKNMEKVCKGAEISNEDVIKLASSLVTHMVIESGISKRAMKDYPIRSLLTSIDKLVYEGGDIEDVKKFIRDRYSRYI